MSIATFTVYDITVNVLNQGHPLLTAQVMIFDPQGNYAPFREIYPGGVLTTVAVAVQIAPPPTVNTRIWKFRIKNDEVRGGPVFEVDIVQDVTMDQTVTVDLRP